MPIRDYLELSPYEKAFTIASLLKQAEDEKKERDKYAK